MVMSPQLTLALPCPVSSHDVIVPDSDLHFSVEGIHGLKNLIPNFDFGLFSFDFLGSDWTLIY
jgi:hypothetical protein